MELQPAGLLRGSWPSVISLRPPLKSQSAWRHLSFLRKLGSASAVKAERLGGSLARFPFENRALHRLSPCESPGVTSPSRTHLAVSAHNSLQNTRLTVLTCMRKVAPKTITAVLTIPSARMVLKLKYPSLSRPISGVAALGALRSVLPWPDFLRSETEKLVVHKGPFIPRSQKKLGLLCSRPYAAFPGIDQ